MKGVIGSPGRFLAAGDNSSSSHRAGLEQLSHNWEAGRRWAADGSLILPPTQPRAQESQLDFPFLCPMVLVSFLFAGFLQSL